MCEKCISKLNEISRLRRVIHAKDKHIIESLSLLSFLLKNYVEPKNHYHYEKQLLSIKNSLG